jgi:beta-galactosidase
MPVGMSEYGAGASVLHHEDDPVKPEPNGAWHPEEWQARYHEATWPQLAARPWLWGGFIWVLFDFQSSGRDEGDRPGINDKGLITEDRKIRKDAFYYYQANWTTKPFVHLAGRRANPRSNPVVDITAYSNCESVELFVRGASQGVITRPSHGVFTWKGISLSAEGGTTVEAIGRKNGQRYRDTVTWTLGTPVITKDSPRRPEL